MLKHFPLLHAGLCRNIVHQKYKSDFHYYVFQYYQEYSYIDELLLEINYLDQMYLEYLNKYKNVDIMK